jgi:endonuclease YncB( thermonuclease family)
MASIIRPDFKHKRRHRERGVSPQKRLTREIPAWVAWCFVGMLFLMALYVSPSIHQRDQLRQTSASTVHIEVVDGDTVRSDGLVFRLVGFNTPESGLNAQCRGERALASKATDRLQQLLNEGAPNLQRVACACDPETEGTQQCNHGRLCAKLTVDGRDVGTILIAEGLAERYECWATSCPRRKDWCRS